MDYNSIVHLTPHFSPQIDGVGDYSRLLAEWLETEHSIKSHFLVGDPCWKRVDRDEPHRFRAVAVRERTEAELLLLLGSARKLILHYVGYGYDRRGVPFWINQALRKWKKADPSRQLIVIFHELWSSAWPWESVFYFRPFQRHLVKELQRLCTVAVTSTPIMFNILNGLDPGKTVFQPISSALSSVPGKIKSTNNAVRIAIFGQTATRLKSINAHKELLIGLNKAGILAEVRVVGKGAGGGCSPSKDVECLQAILPEGKISIFGNVSTDQGALLLSEADFFLSFYPSAFLCKSSALMTALACGVVPIVPETGDAAPLMDGKELLSCDGSVAGVRRVIDQITAGTVAGMGEEGRRWYDRNASWPVASARIAGLLSGVPVDQIK